MRSALREPACSAQGSSSVASRPLSSAFSRQDAPTTDSAVIGMPVCAHASSDLMAEQVSSSFVTASAHIVSPARK